MSTTIHLGDASSVLGNLPKDSIDLVLTSPPYDNLRTYEGKSNWNFDTFKRVADELIRVIKPGGVIVWVVGDATINGSETGSSFRQALYFKDSGLRIHDTMIYAKTGISFPESNRYYPAFEYMFIFSKGKPKTVNLIRDRKNKRCGDKIGGTERQPDGTTKPKSAVRRATGSRIKPFGVRFNIWTYANGFMISAKDKIAFEHPAIFPEQLAHDHIVSWSNPGDVVLDPFMGSGTTGKQCVLLDRNFIGIDCVEEYCEIARQRIEVAKELRAASGIA